MMRRVIPMSLGLALALALVPSLVAAADQAQGLLADLAATDALTAGEEIASVLATAPAADWVERLRAVGVGVAEVFPHGFDRWLERSGLLEPASHWLFGDYWRLPPKVRLSGSAPVQGSACAPGEHSSALLDELGFAVSDLDVMRRDGVTSDCVAKNS